MGPSFKGCPWYIVKSKKHAVKEGKTFKLLNAMFV